MTLRVVAEFETGANRANVTPRVVAEVETGANRANVTLRSVAEFETGANRANVTLRSFAEFETGAMRAVSAYDAAARRPIPRRSIVAAMFICSRTASSVLVSLIQPTSAPNQMS